MKKKIIYGIIFIILLVTEILIALFVHDNFIRPYIGDVLVVVVIYYFIRIFIPEQYRWLPLSIFLFATFVECLQYFNVVSLLGLESNRFMRILLGSTFDIKDIVCYGAGCILLGLKELVSEKQKKSSV